jgi:hypothetical protein
MTGEELVKRYPKEWKYLREILDNRVIPVDDTGRKYETTSKVPVNLVVPTIGVREQIVDTIDTLLTQTYPYCRIYISCQANMEAAERLREMYSGTNVEVLYYPDRIGWVRACNEVAKKEGHLFCLADDVAITREVVEILVSEMDRLFPDGDGVLLTNQTYTKRDENKKQGSACAFPFLGNGYIQRFPERQVLCPDYIFYSSDIETPEFAHSIRKCFVIPDAKIIHFERGTMGKDVTSKLVRESGLPDIETYFLRKREGFFWGKDFNLMYPPKRKDRPFLTVLTRCHPKRQECIQRNIRFIQNQTFNDIQHLLLKPKVEPTGSPRDKAIAVGELIYKAAPYVEGEYVIQIDDDDMPASKYFVERLKKIVDRDNPDMIVFRCQLGSMILPDEEHWNNKHLEEAKVAGPNICVRREIYEQAKEKWLIPRYESDFDYIVECERISKKIVWENFVGTCSQGVRPNNIGEDESTFSVKDNLWGY